jgi:hypothetical protein
MTYPYTSHLVVRVIPQYLCLRYCIDMTAVRQCKAAVRSTVRSIPAMLSHLDHATTMAMASLSR